MYEALSGSLSLIDTSGYLIIATIFVFLALGVLLTLVVRARYARIGRDLRAHGATGAFQAALLNHIVADVQAARARLRGEVNVQAIVEHRFRSELGGMLTAERFIKASTGLMIILGLVGTFYGLTLSIGKLVALVSPDAAAATELTRALTQGLTQALSGMSVAFSTSLVGIVAAIIMTALGVLANVPDRREAIMVEIETYIEHVVLGTDIEHAGMPSSTEGFTQSVAQLQDVVTQFQASLELFSSSTRDFREFNSHLKDNIQRMSLGFADLSDTLKEQAERLRPRDRS